MGSGGYPQGEGASVLSLSPYLSLPLPVVGGWGRRWAQGGVRLGSSECGQVMKNHQTVTSPKTQPQGLDSTLVPTSQ